MVTPFTSDSHYQNNIVDTKKGPASRSIKKASSPLPLPSSETTVTSTKKRSITHERKPTKGTESKALLIASTTLLIDVGIHQLIYRSSKPHKAPTEKIIDYGAFFTNYATHLPSEKASFYSQMESHVLNLSLSDLELFLKDLPKELHTEEHFNSFITYLLAQTCRSHSENPDLIPFLEHVKVAMPNIVTDDPLIFYTKAHINSLQLPEPVQAYILQNDLPPSVAIDLLSIMAQSKTSIGIEPEALKRLCTASTLSAIDLLEKWQFYAENSVLLANLIVLCPPEKQEQALKNVMIALCKRGNFELADSLIKSLLPTVERKREPASMLSTLYTKLTYLCAYGLWYTTQYSSDARFTGLEKQELIKHINEEKFEEIEAVFAGEILHKIQDTAALFKPDDASFEKILLWLYEKKLPVSFATHPEFVSFLQATKLHSLAKYYNHPLRIDETTKSPMILIEGALRPFSEIAERFTLVQGKSEIEIIEKATNKRWSYLEKGLVPHNPDLELRPFKTVDRSQEADPQHLITFNYISEGHTNSLSGIKRLREHMWLNLCTPEGELYSAGNLSADIIRSPDVYEFLPLHKKTVTFAVSKYEFRRLFREIMKKQSGDKESFNFVRSNCSSFCAQVASTVIPDGLSPMTPLGIFNSLETRVKSFVIARELATLCAHNRQRMFDAIKAYESTQIGSLTYAFHNELKRIAQENSTFREYCDVFKIFAQNNRFLQTFDAAVGVFQGTILNDPKEILQSKLFNLFADAFEAAKNITIDTPAMLYQQLSSLPENV